MGISSQAMIAELAAYEIGSDAINDCNFMSQSLHFMIASLPMDQADQARISFTMPWTSAI